MLEGVLNTTKYASKTHLSGSKHPKSVCLCIIQGSPEHIIIMLTYILELRATCGPAPAVCVWMCVGSYPVSCEKYFMCVIISLDDVCVY